MVMSMEEVIKLKKYHNNLMNKIYKLPYSSIHFKALLTSHASDVWLKIEQLENKIK